MLGAESTGTTPVVGRHGSTGPVLGVHHALDLLLPAESIARAVGRRPFGLGAAAGRRWVSPAMARPNDGRRRSPCRGRDAATIRFSARVDASRAERAGHRTLRARTPLWWCWGQNRPAQCAWRAGTDRPHPPWVPTVRWIC